MQEARSAIAAARGACGQHSNTVSTSRPAGSNEQLQSRRLPRRRPPGYRVHPCRRLLSGEPLAASAHSRVSNIRSSFTAGCASAIPRRLPGYFDLGDFAIASASPERFLRVCEWRSRNAADQGHPAPRPDAGGRRERRSPTWPLPPKDRAENVMIVDLLRNDLGRVCEYGTVRVPQVCRLETFRYVHHLVSEVRGQLRPRAGAARSAAGGVSRRFGDGSAEGAGDGDHRRVGADGTRAVLRQPRLSSASTARWTRTS